MASMYIPRAHPHPRMLGAAVGSAISCVLVVASGLMDLVSSGNPTVPPLFVPTLAAGTLGGALLGPRALRTAWTATWRSRFGIRIRLALAAIVIGAPVVALQLGVDSLLRSEEPRGLFDLLAGTLVLTPLGIVFYGPFALPFTYGAALVWTWLMRRIAPPS